MPESAAQARPPAPGFWARQFRRDPTTEQRQFDWAFGIVLPLFCIMADPGILSGTFFLGRPMFAGFCLFAYTEIVIGLVALGSFLLRRRPSALLAGILAASAAFSLVLGCAMLPTTIAGLTVVIGILGLTPFATAFVFLRNAQRCWSRLLAPPRRLVRVKALATFLLFVILPAGAQWGLNQFATQAVARIRSGTEAELHATVALLRSWPSLVASQDILDAYHATDSDAERERLAGAYLELTGGTLPDLQD